MVGGEDRAGRSVEGQLAGVYVQLLPVLNIDK